MATLHKAFPTGRHEPRDSTATKEQLRKDRAKGVLVFLILAALMALMIWLASLGTGTPESIDQIWPTMP